jgi:DNA polymerase III alpha subunit
VIFQRDELFRYPVLVGECGCGHVAGEVGHVHALGSWHISPDWEARAATSNTTDWGTDRYTGLELIEDALNLKTPTVYDLNEDKKPVVNAQATEAAREKQERIKNQFKEWVWSDDGRRERLCRLYNDTFNHTRLGEHVGETVVTCGLVVEQRTHHQITGEPMKFLTLTDWTGMVETELFAQTYKNYALATVRFPVLEITAIVEPFENGRGFSLRVLRAGKPRTSERNYAALTI